MVEWNPSFAAGLLFLACLVLSGWAVLWLLDGWQLNRRMNRWTVAAVSFSVVVLLGCAAGLFLLQG